MIEFTDIKHGRFVHGVSDRLKININLMSTGDLVQVGDVTYKILYKHFFESKIKVWVKVDGT